MLYKIPGHGYSFFVGHPASRRLKWYSAKGQYAPEGVIENRECELDILRQSVDSTTLGENQKQQESRAAIHSFHNGVDLMSSLRAFAFLSVVHHTVFGLLTVSLGSVCCGRN